MLSLTANRVYLLCAFLMACSFTVWGQSAMLPLGEIVGRMQAAELDSLSHVAPYRVTRQYVLSGSDQKTSSSRVTAEISFVPPSQKDYSLGAVQGNDRVGKVVRKVLDHEADMTSHAKRVMVSDENYSFVLLGSEVIEGHRCYVLQLTPKRDMSDLIRGTAWVWQNSLCLGSGPLRRNPKRGVDRVVRWRLRPASDLSPDKRPQPQGLTVSR